MSNTVVSGMQWGDEGKGKIVDLLCPAFDAVVRYQAGDNAGHTVKFGSEHFALHLVPSGILHPGSSCVLGNGMVVNPERLFAELDGLAEAGVETAGQLFISERAQVLLPVFAELDRVREEASGRRQIGTTARGIGPAYEAKSARLGIRMCDLFADDLEERLERLVRKIDREISQLGGEPIGAVEPVLQSCREWRERLAPMLCDTATLLNGWADEGRNLLFEGAQGVLLDIDHGTYPFVTSSNPSAGGACTGTGVPPTRIDGVVGVLKAYTTRVGSGPFVTELEGDSGEYLRERGQEFGTTTGRPRRCGWLDLVMARYARMISGIDTIALTKLDVLDGLDEIQLCVGYRIDGEEVDTLPPRLADLARAEPMYETVPGWPESTVGAVDFEELPQNARDYVGLIEEQVGAPVSLVSTGPRREETLIRPEPKLRQLTSGRLDAVLSERFAM